MVYLVYLSDLCLRQVDAVVFRKFHNGSAIVVKDFAIRWAVKEYTSLFHLFIFPTLYTYT